MPLIIHEPDSIPTHKSISRVAATPPIVFFICSSKVLQRTLYIAIERHTHTDIPISRAI